MLTHEQTGQIAMFLRVVGFNEKHAETMSRHEGWTEADEEFRGMIRDLMEQLTDEERDQVLERYAADKAAMAAREAKK